ncbi:EamA-like transporter family protein [Spirosoma oryzae]|uniref:EamA-like transporter family protein n=1 Tax=Spirosoma oryzae TaxID=1469603 RepID=A0A2T0SVY7_9BACT|nr:EamA family transporter [Spirosoma oryzae]PRY37584.1 EamA-like transporter family protein [Spirosoma oryzae]
MEPVFISLTSLAVLIRIVANPLANVFQKQLTHRAVDPLFVTGATFGLLTVACLLGWPQLRFIDLPTSFWLNMVLTSLFAVLGNVFLVRALRIGDLSVLGPINAYKSVVGLLLGVVVLHEIPRWWGIVGVVLLIVGSYVVVANRQERLSWTVVQQPAVRLRLMALVFSAADGVFLKKAILTSTPFIAFFYWCGLSFLVTLGWITLTIRHNWRSQLTTLASHKRLFLGLCAMVGLTQFTSNLVLSRVPVGYALALFQLSALVSVGLGYHFFQEQHILRKLLGALVMVGGAALITLLG